MEEPSHFFFGKWTIDPRVIFYQTNLSFCIVNHKPVVPGHVLAIPKRVVARVKDLTEEELCDLMITARRIANAVEKKHNALYYFLLVTCYSQSVNYSVQDGIDAGQTVEHVHIHVLPRRPNDFSRNDEIYEKLDRVDKSDSRSPRTIEDMAKEAVELQELV